MLCIFDIRVNNLQARVNQHFRVSSEHLQERGLIKKISYVDTTLVGKLSALIYTFDSVRLKLSMIDDYLVSNECADIC